MVKTPCSLYRGHVFDLSSGNLDSACHGKADLKKKSLNKLDTEAMCVNIT